MPNTQSFGVRAAIISTAAFASLMSSHAYAAMAVSPIFGSNMVLQRSATVPVFGTGDPGATVTVAFQNQTVQATVDAAGKWRANLASMAASAAPASMTVSQSGGNSVTFTGVQVGEVWVCSGQSNMGKPLSYADGSAPYIADAGNYNIRLFRMIAGNGPSTTTWTASNSTTAANFSAVGYFMGLDLQRSLNVPVGLIQATHDGTGIENWQHTDGGTGVDYDAMVKPIQPFAVKGVAWYQGESNGGDSTYETKLTNMIAAWRSDWGLSSLPFGIVQLPASKWTAARSAQFNVSQKVANTYLVVTADQPGASQLHPTAKYMVGIRCSIGARGMVYGQPIEWSGPIPSKAGTTVNGTTVNLAFTHVGNGLITNNGAAPSTFAVSAATRYTAATAAIAGPSVTLTSSVSGATHIQYGFSGLGNLWNAVNIPTEGGTKTVTSLPSPLFQLDLP